MDGTLDDHPKTPNLPLFVPAVLTATSSSSSLPTGHDNPYATKTARASTASLAYPPKKKAKKPADELLRNCFIVTEFVNGSGTLMFKAECKYCAHQSEFQKFNATKCRQHLISSCSGVDDALKVTLVLNSQGGKKSAILRNLLVNDRTTSLGTQSTSDVRVDVLARADTAKSSLQKASATKIKTFKQLPITGPTNFGPALDQKSAERIIISQVEATVARGEPISRFLDPYVRAALFAANPALAHFLPADKDTIFEKYVVPIDLKTSAELQEHMARIPGCINISFDTVTVNGSSKCMYTVTKGAFSAFYTMTDLGSDKHVTEEEIKDALKVCNEIAKKYNGNCYFFNCSPFFIALNSHSHSSCLLHLL